MEKNKGRNFLSTTSRDPIRLNTNDITHITARVDISNEYGPWPSGHGPANGSNMEHIAVFWAVYSSPFTRQNIEHMGKACLIDELSSKRDRPRAYGTAHLLDSLSSLLRKWDGARSLNKQIKAMMVVEAILISLAPSYFIRERAKERKWVKSAEDT